MDKGIPYALLAAALFGASTPLAKLLSPQLSPILLAGLLYLGSGVGLTFWFLLRRWRKTGGEQIVRLRAADARWLAGAILSGGVTGPVLLMYGLASTPASSAALLLNLEGVLTALLAWFVFKENFDRRILAGMLLIVLAGMLLSWQQRQGAPQSGPPLGALAIAGACLCWAIDNNLTRKISANDAVHIAGLKGLAAAAVNLSLATALGADAPGLAQILAAGAIGFCGYGLSLVLFVLALRQLGSARTGAYFSVAPFAGAALAIGLLHETPGPWFWPAAALMALGIWLHLSERHAHRHSHEPQAHAHTHVHDAHHQHAHDFPWDSQEPHSHHHQHVWQSHIHAHFPDIHHQHKH